MTAVVALRHEQKNAELVQTLNDPIRLSKLLKFIAGEFSENDLLGYLALRHMLTTVPSSPMWSYFMTNFVEDSAPLQLNLKQQQFADLKKIAAMNPAGKVYSVQAVAPFAQDANWWDAPTRARSSTSRGVVPVVPAPVGTPGGWDVASRSRSPAIAPAAVHKTALQAAGTEVFNLIERDSWARFSKSDAVIPAALPSSTAVKIKDCLRELSALGVSAATSLLVHLG